MPDARELPRVRRAVVPLVRARDALVRELVADRLPRLAAVVGALDHLPEPAARLRRVEPVRVRRRSLEVIDLPARKVRPADVPPLALAVRRSGRTRPCVCRPAPEPCSYPHLPRVLVDCASTPHRDPFRCAPFDRAPSIRRRRFPGAAGLIRQPSDDRHVSELISSNLTTSPHCPR